MGARSDCALEKPWKKALNEQEHRSGRVESAWMGSSRGSAGGFCLEGGGEGAGALQVPFRGHGKPQRMGPVKSLTTSQVLPYNLSHYYAWWIQKCPTFPELQGWRFFHLEKSLL